MKNCFTVTALGLCLIVPVLAQSAEPKSFEEKLSYAFGFEVGSYFQGQVKDIKKEFFIAAVEDALGTGEPALPLKEMQTIKEEYAEKMQAIQLAQLEELKTKNKAAGEVYLAENKKKKGVIVTKSGLQYQVIKEGKGENAKLTDTVKVNYAGTLIDGTEFDSTAKHGKPAEIKVEKVIKGWGEALQLMNVGSKLRIVIPAELAYGENGVPPRIEPNAVLIFEVELLSIEK